MKKKKDAVRDDYVFHENYMESLRGMTRSELALNLAAQTKKLSSILVYIYNEWTEQEVSFKEFAIGLIEESDDYAVMLEMNGDYAVPPESEVLNSNDE